MLNIEMATIITKPVDIADANAKIHNIDFIIDSLKKRRAELGVYIVKMVDSKDVE